MVNYPLVNPAHSYAPAPSPVGTGEGEGKALMPQWCPKGVGVTPWTYGRVVRCGGAGTAVL